MSTHLADGTNQNGCNALETKGQMLKYLNLTGATPRDSFASRAGKPCQWKFDRHVPASAARYQKMQVSLARLSTLSSPAGRWRLCDLHVVGDMALTIYASLNRGTSCRRYTAEVMVFWQSFEEVDISAWLYLGFRLSV